jgi:amidase
MNTFPEFDKYDGLGLGELVRTRQVSPSELVEEAIRRIEAYNPKINAVIYKMYEQARKAAQGEVPDGPFKGVPFLQKDMHATVAGVPTCCGTRMLKDIPQPHDSEMVRRYRAAGVIMLGKTNVPEFSIRWAVPAVVRRRRWQRGWCPWQAGPTEAVPSASRLRAVVCSD